jgi:hypothetical protein
VVTSNGMLSATKMKVAYLIHILPPFFRSICLSRRALREQIARVKHLPTAARGPALQIPALFAPDFQELDGHHQSEAVSRIKARFFHVCQNAFSNICSSYRMFDVDALAPFETLSEMRQKRVDDVILGEVS